MSKIIRYLDYIIYWSIVLVPFSVSIAPAPMNVFMGLLIVAFLAKKILMRDWHGQGSVITVPLIFLFAVTCLSVFNSACLRDSLRGGVFRLFQYILIFYCLVEEIKDQRHIRNILIFMCLGAVLASGDAVFQVLTGRDFLRGYRPIVNIGLVRATAGFKDSNVLGIYLSALAPVLLGLSLYYFKKIKRAALSLVSIFVLIGIALTYSRPTLLAIYVTLLFLGIVKKDKILIGILIIFTLLAPFILPKSVKDWAKEVEYNPIRFLCNDDRIAVYRNSLNMIKAHPILGVGANAYMKSYKQYKENPEYRGVVTLSEMKAHNNFFQMAAEIGLTGLIIFIWLLYRLFRECKIIYSSLPEGYLKIVSLSLISCLISFLVNGLTESSLYYSSVAVLFWYLSGLSLSSPFTGNPAHGRGGMRKRSCFGGCHCMGKSYSSSGDDP